MPGTPYSCRLFVILASEAPKAVIFRRGPSIWTEIILWDTKADTFTEGQWFKGKLYTRCCDLSPDGSKLLYFAAKHYKPYPGGSTPTRFPSNEWTAISRVPYLTPLATIQTIGTWDGGGYFADNNTVYVNEARYIPDKNNPPPLKIERFNVPPEIVFKPVEPDGHYSEEQLYEVLLERRGWRPERSADRPEDEDAGLWRTWCKDHPSQPYRLWMTLHNEKRAILHLGLKDSPESTKIPIPSDTWADWDQQGRLVFTHEGRLYAGGISRSRITPVLLADFRPNQVRLIESPAWARSWE